MGVRATAISTAIQPFATFGNRSGHRPIQCSIATVGMALKSLPRNDIWLPALISGVDAQDFVESCGNVKAAGLIESPGVVHRRTVGHHAG
jgi:hypothetical protein